MTPVLDSSYTQHVVRGAAGREWIAAYASTHDEVLGRERREAAQCIYYNDIMFPAVCRVSPSSILRIPGKVEGVGPAFVY